MTKYIKKLRLKKLYWIGFWCSWLFNKKEEEQAIVL